ncbi:hypothetical protein ACFL29_01865 [Patescibacteria group bacterium]
MNLFQKTLITIATLLIFGAIIVIFVIYPAILDIQTFNDRIQLERVALENKYTGRRNIKNIVADLKQVSEQLVPLMEKMVIQEGQEVDFIGDIEEVAIKNNLVQKIKILPTEEKKQELASRRNINIALSGDYIDILKYLNDLEHSEHYIIIYAIHIGSGTNQVSAVASAGTVKANLEGYVYFSS